MGGGQAVNEVLTSGLTPALPEIETAHPIHLPDNYETCQAFSPSCRLSSPSPLFSFLFPRFLSGEPLLRAPPKALAIIQPVTHGDTL